MDGVDIRILLSEIRVQLNRNGLPADLVPEPDNYSRPDINAIRMTIEREEKTYQLQTVV